MCVRRFAHTIYIQGFNNFPMQSTHWTLSICAETYIVTEHSQADVIKYTKSQHEHTEAVTTQKNKAVKTLSRTHIYIHKHTHAHTSEFAAFVYASHTRNLFVNTPFIRLHHTRIALATSLHTPLLSFFHFWIHFSDIENRMWRCHMRTVQ